MDDDDQAVIREIAEELEKERHKLDDREQVIDRAIGDELRAARNSAGWSRPQLVKRVRTKMPVNTYGCYEQGIRACSIARLVELCDALGTTAPDLLNRALARITRLTFPRITSDPDVMNGLPCIRDLHIPVSTVISQLADGLSADDVLAGFPGLTAEDVAEALRYAAHHVARTGTTTTPSPSADASGSGC